MKRSFQMPTTRVTHWPPPSYLEFVARVTRRMPLVEQALLTLPEHLNSSPVFSGIRVTRSFVLYVIKCFVDRCMSFLSFFFWQLCCLSFDLRIRITSLVSSNSSRLFRKDNILLETPIRRIVIQMIS